MFKAWPKIPRIANEKYHFSEKIDGTNAGVILLHINHDLAVGYGAPAPIAQTADGTCLWAQSRTRLITPGDDNFGFATWAAANVEELAKLGHGYFYGEWWGKGIQRGYGLAHRCFSLFYYPGELPTAAVQRVPTLGTATLADAVALLKEQGSQAAPGFMNPEGVVMYCEQAKTYYKEIINK